MALRPDQIMHDVQALLDLQIRMTMSGAVSCLTDAQWREHSKREARIAALLWELDAVNSPPINGKNPHRETEAPLSAYRQAS